MLKSLTPAEPELVSLCRFKAWEAMARRCKTYPEEAKPTSLALEGAGTTALAIAVRSDAPFGAIQALVQANPSQLVVFHKYSGSILHEALKHHVPFRILEYLLQSVIHYEHVHFVQKVDYVSLFGRQEHLGRTVLHHMVVRSIQEMEHNGNNDDMWRTFRSIVMAYPPAVQVLDADGNTPLVLTLLYPNSIQRERDEDHLHRMAQLMIHICPSVVTITRKGKYGPLPQDCKRSNDAVPPTTGDGRPTPLSIAILYGRSDDTIRLLLQACYKINENPCLTICSGNGEVPLHLATSMRSSLDMLRDFVDCDPRALHVRDKYSLTPLDWLWIRHVVDWNSNTTQIANIMPSTRRYLSPHFASWHNVTSNDMMDDIDDVGAAKRQLLDSLLERMQLLLVTAAARKLPRTESMLNTHSLSLLHSACAVPCPLALVHLACCNDTKSLRIPDVHMCRLPLHYAAARPGYRATISVGVSREIRTMVESYPAIGVALRYKEATRVVDANHQLPLHILIDTVKQENDNHGASVVSKLLSFYPDSLERRDGKTLLYPFLQAAHGSNASVNLSFMLLRKNPTLVSSSGTVYISK